MSGWGGGECMSVGVAASCVWGWACLGRRFVRGLVARVMGDLGMGLTHGHMDLGRGGLQRRMHGQTASRLEGG